MDKLKLLALLGMLFSGGAIVYGFAAGDFALEGVQLLQMPWGIVALIDLYTGFALFAAWMVYREASLARALVWVALLLTLGFFIGSLYVWLAARASGGDWLRFWQGARAH